MSKIDPPVSGTAQSRVLVFWLSSVFSVPSVICKMLCGVTRSLLGEERGGGRQVTVCVFPEDSASLRS